MAENIWYCKIGGDVGGGLPLGSDAPMRTAIERAFRELTGRDAEFTFSGWGQKLTEGERAIVEHRAPRLCDLDRPHQYECKNCGIGPPTTAQETGAACDPYTAAYRDCVDHLNAAPSECICPKCGLRHGVRQTDPPTF